jgi:undecaprenyl diphosphate synthase
VLLGLSAATVDVDDLVVATGPFFHGAPPAGSTSVATMPDAPTHVDHLLHVACIMDGNGRWAARRGLPRTDGHTAGEENIARLVRVAVHRDIGWLTLFGFSTENWRRPRTEVRHILGLHEKLFGRIAELNELNVRIRWIGRPFDSPESRTPRYVQRAIRRAIADTAQNTGLVLTIAFDYGGRAELVAAADAARRSAEGITPESIARHLYFPELPPVDVLVRTSGERRISNFLLWQAAGAAVYFTDAAWPDFDADELDRALALVG